MITSGLCGHVRPYDWKFAWKRFPVIQQDFLLEFNHRSEKSLNCVSIICGPKKSVIVVVVVFFIMFLVWDPVFSPSPLSLFSFSHLPATTRIPSPSTARPSVFFFSQSGGRAGGGVGVLSMDLGLFMVYWWITFFVQGIRDHRDLHSSHTRRSYELPVYKTYLHKWHHPLQIQYYKYK